MRPGRMGQGGVEPERTPIMDRYRFEAMFHATDGSGDRHFRECLFEATDRDAAASEAERLASAPPGMWVERASLSDMTHGTIWALPPGDR